VQIALLLCFVDISSYIMLELNDVMTRAFHRAPPTHQMAVGPVIFALTFKARNSADRVLGTDVLIKSSVLSYQKQGISPQCLVSE